METLIALILQAGKDALNVSLYILLPIMVVMMILVKILDVTGLLNKFTAVCAPFTRPFGLTGLSLLAMIQISFVSFVAPLPTLKLMEDQGVSDRKLAAGFAAVLAMAPANSLFPLAMYGLDLENALAISFMGGVVASTLTFWFFGKSLSNTQIALETPLETTHTKFSLLKIINTSGREAIEVVINIIPMLLVSLFVVYLLNHMGLVAYLQQVLSPILRTYGIDTGLVLPSLTKYMAGSTAFLGVLQNMHEKHQLTTSILNLASAGALLHPLDLPGVAIFISAGQRIKKVLVPALMGAIVAIILRMTLGLIV